MASTISTTPVLGFPMVSDRLDSQMESENQAILYREALIKAQIVDRNLTAPPGVQPADGTIYLVAAGGTGAWASQDGKLAIADNRTSGGWKFVTLWAGATFWIVDEATGLTWNGSAWIADDGSSALPLAGGTMSGAINMGSQNIVSVNGVGIGTSDFASGAANQKLAIQNNADEDHHIRIRSGVTGDYRNYLRFEDWQGSQMWLTGRNASNYWILYDTVGTTHRMLCVPSGITYLNSSGTAHVVVNGYATESGTGGLDVMSGGSSPWVTHSFRSNTVLTGLSGGIHTLLKNNDTDATAQYARVALRHYTSSEEPACLFYGQSTASASVVNFGGGSGAVNAITQYSFFAAANNTTTTGTEIARWTTAGLMLNAGGVTANASDTLHVASASYPNTFRASGTYGTVGIGTAPSTTLALHAYHGTTDEVARFESGDAGALISIKDSDGTSYIERAGSVGVLKFKPTSTKEMLRLTDSGGARLENAVSSNPHSSALLDMTSTARGFLPPRMTEAQRDAIGTPATGLVVYNTDTNLLNFYNGSVWGAV